MITATVYYILALYNIVEGFNDYHPAMMLLGILMVVLGATT